MLPEKEEQIEHGVGDDLSAAANAAVAAVGELPLDKPDRLVGSDVQDAEGNTWHVAAQIVETDASSAGAASELLGNLYLLHRQDPAQRNPLYMRMRLPVSQQQQQQQQEEEEEEEKKSRL